MGCDGCRERHNYGDVAQGVESYFEAVEVVGSTPTITTNDKFMDLTLFPQGAIVLSCRGT